MLRSLLGRGRAAGPRAPSDCVVYAVGDIHGRADLLEPLLQAIEVDRARSVASRQVVVFLGDYGDRGPDTKAVFDILTAYAQSSSAQTRFIRGNHEDCLVAFMRDPTTGPGWCEFGGRETLASYGVTPPARRAAPEDWATAAEALRSAMPETHLALLEQLEPSVELGDYFVTHAGARPDVALADQSDHDLMWIRADFLDSPTRFDRVIIHGHTPEVEVHRDHRRWGIDTGAYATGVLTALRLEGSVASLLQTQVAGGVVSVRAMTPAR